MLKQVCGGELVRAIRTVGRGESLLDPAVTNTVLDRLRKGKHLLKDERLARLSRMAVFYTLTAIWPEHNPFVDEHVVYAIALVVIAMLGAGRHLGLGKRWEQTALVKRFPVLK